MKNLPFFLLLFLIFNACQTETKVVDHSHIPNAFEVAVEIPAGDVKDQSFLPFPANVGYLKGETTILILSKRLEKGTSIPVRPIATLQILENNQSKDIIISTPVDSLLSLSATTNFQQFITENAGEKQIIQDWFLYQKGLGKTSLIGWEDEHYATQIVKRNLGQ